MILEILFDLIESVIYTKEFHILSVILHNSQELLILTICAINGVKVRIQ